MAHSQSHPGQTDTQPAWMHGWMLPESVTLTLIHTHTHTHGRKKKSEKSHSSVQASTRYPSRVIGAPAKQERQFSVGEMPFCVVDW
mmetsp:Transcript_15756/g.37581  ORF Transcript_15756/g.37581 Transcript_15756/m.37581 type:complete len:86 (-) Transcript_15756:1669-1926(-)